MKRVQITIAGQEYPMLLSMLALQEIEETFGGVQEMFKALTDGKNLFYNIIDVVTILINGGLAAEDKPPLSHSYIASRMLPADIAASRWLIQQAIMQGMRNEKTENDESEHDEVLEELDKKKANRQRRGASTGLASQRASRIKK